jgi:hypothetical protein
MLVSREATGSRSSFRSAWSCSEPSRVATSARRKPRSGADDHAIAGAS